jgi:hypothetical protein
MVPISSLIRPNRIFRPQAGNAKQSFQLIRRQRLFHVVDDLEIYALRSQDPLDLATLGSRWLLVNDDLGGTFHFYLLLWIVQPWDQA